MSIPDARRSGIGIAWKERRTGPRHAAVWVRIGGRWRRGRIIEWVRELDRDGWECVILADEPTEGTPWQGRYVFDPRSIRPRYTDQQPTLAAVLLVLPAILRGRMVAAPAGERVEDIKCSLSARQFLVTGNDRGDPGDEPEHGIRTVPQADHDAADDPSVFGKWGQVHSAGLQWHALETSV